MAIDSRRQGRHVQPRSPHGNRATFAPAGLKEWRYSTHPTKCHHRQGGLHKCGKRPCLAGIDDTKSCCIAAVIVRKQSPETCSRNAQITPTTRFRHTGRMPFAQCGWGYAYYSHQHCLLCLLCLLCQWAYVCCNDINTPMSNHALPNGGCHVISLAISTSISYSHLKVFAIITLAEWSQV